MTLAETSDLMREPVFVGRVKSAGLKYSMYILDESPGTAGHNSRYRWAQEFALDPDMRAMRLAPLVVQDASVQSAGGDIEDGPLQSAVEITINRFI